jgi:hypothetical protein
VPQLVTGGVGLEVALERRDGVGLLGL